jgi:hypothetical protein
MTLENLPRPDASRFSPIPSDAVMIAYLACRKLPTTTNQIRRGLKGWLTEAEINDALDVLVGDSHVRVGEKIELTQSGKDKGKKIIGVDAEQKWENIVTRRFVMLALGLDPDDSDVRRRFARWDAQQAAVIAVSFALPRKEMASTKAVCGELVWQTLKAGLSEVVGRGPFPVIDKLAAVERMILAGLAGGRPVRTIPQAITAVTAVSLGMKECNADSMRHRLIELAVQRATTPPTPYTTVRGGSAPANGQFATLVKQLAEQLTTPPFQGRVAIAQVYDAYGRIHPDAGSLTSFKARLIEAAKRHEILLGRLDLPERMDKDLRLRSETPWDTEYVHFVLTASRQVP